MRQKFGVAVVGAGYWGPKLARNFRSSPDWDLVAVCDLDERRARNVVGARSTVEVETSFERLLARSDVDAIAIATPANSHAALALAAFDAGKHVVVEKPLAPTSAEAATMIEAGAAAGLTLMVDHTYCYAPAVEYIHDIVAKGILGHVLYIDSTRINLGLVQPDVDVFWDLAPHDLAILDYALPGGLVPELVSATGADPLGAGKACVGYATMPLGNGGVAHVNVNWMSPTKIRRMVIGGSHRTLVWDDLNPQQRVAIHDRGIDLAASRDVGDVDKRRTSAVSYRLGDITVPAIAETEALSSMVTEFAAAIREQRPPRTDGVAGLRVLAVLEAISESLAGRGMPVRPEDATLLMKGAYA